MRLSTSKVKCYKGCRRLYYFKYIEELESVQEAQALTDGKTYHSKIESLYNSGWFEIDIENLKITAMAMAYEKYIYPQFKCHKAEEWFDITLNKRKKHNLVGRFDAIADDGCVVEHKTTSNDVDDAYIYNLRLDEQILNYMIASGKNRMYYTVCKKPTIRQRQNETPEQFLERCIAWYEEDTENKIRVISVTRNEKEIDEQKVTLCFIADEMRKTEKLCREADTEQMKKVCMYRNPAYCQQYGRTCEFAGICLDYDPKLEYIEFRKKEKEN